jgi:thioredoxin 1
MAIDTIIHTNQHSIDRVIGAGTPVVLVFWQRNQELPSTIEGALQQAAKEHAGRLLIAKVDAKTEPTLIQRFSARRLPTLVFLKAGKVEGMLSGNITPADLQKWLNYLVQGGARPGPQPAQQANGSAGAGPITLTDANFQQVVSGPGPVLVDFWAPWCGPCRMVAPVVEQLAREYSGRAVVGKLNVDENQQTAQQYNIMGIPALYIFKNGNVVDQIVGAQPAHVLKQRLEQQVN